MAQKPMTLSEINDLVVQRCLATAEPTQQIGFSGLQTIGTLSDGRRAAVRVIEAELYIYIRLVVQDAEWMDFEFGGRAETATEETVSVFLNYYMARLEKAKEEWASWEASQSVAKAEDAPMTLSEISNFVVQRCLANAGTTQQPAGTGPSYLQTNGTLDNKRLAVVRVAEQGDLTKISLEVPGPGDMGFEFAVITDEADKDRVGLYLKNYMDLHQQAKARWEASQNV